MRLRFVWFLLVCALRTSTLYCADGGRSMESFSFKNGGVDLHAVAAGPKNGPVVILLHGFPEFWYGWHRQIQPFAPAWFPVIVPHQRGYHPSSKPPRVPADALPKLRSDAIALPGQL